MISQSGRENIYMSYINQLIHHLHGIKKYFPMHRKKFFFSSPFDLSSLKLLENLNALFTKYSPEIQDLELIGAVAKTKTNHHKQKF